MLASRAADPDPGILVEFEYGSGYKENSVPDAGFRKGLDQKKF